MKPSLHLIWVCLLLLTACAQRPVFEKNKTVYRIGDVPEWADMQFDDESWQQRPRWVPDGQIFWSRTRIDILEETEALHPYGIRLEVYGEYEVFWDGILIGKNGNPGQEAVLPPEGKLWTTFSIPTKLTDKGEHLLAIRTSLYYYPDHTAIYSLEIDHYDELLTDKLIETSYMHIFAGAFLITSIYFLFLFLGNKKEYPMLIFSISCFLFFVLILTEFIKTNVSIHYSDHVTRLEIIGFLMFGISFLIPFYFSRQFPFPRRKLVLILYAGVLLFVFLIRHHYFNFTARNMALSMWLFSFGIVVYGTYKKKKGARLVLLTLLLCIVLPFLIPFTKGLYAGFGLILLSMFYLLSLSIKEQRIAYENSLVQSTRLRLELLKKNIQPHVLMNTLTSLIDWVEEAPKKGVLFIESLSREFDLFNQIENEKLIPITQEIALCKTHLEIMEYRKEINYSWDDEGIDPNEKVPPAILHTLLENGITHSMPHEDNSIRFKLIFESNDQSKCYTFLTFAGGARKMSREEGTGLKYIKARLTESYDTKWELTSESEEHGWRNVIKIFA